MQMFPSNHVIVGDEAGVLWSIDLVRTRLTRSIGMMIPDVMDEIKVSLQDCIPVGDGGE